MASYINRFFVVLFLVVVAAAAVVVVSDAAGADPGPMVGGRSEIPNVKSNQEVQDLGRYCVNDYNKKNNGGVSLVFQGVTKAQKQVVAGIKYYLTVSVLDGVGGVGKTYEAVVVVKAWLKSTQVLSFSPSN